MSSLYSSRPRLRQASKRKLGLLNLLAAAGPALAPPTLLLPLLLAAAVDPSDPVSR